MRCQLVAICRLVAVSFAAALGAAPLAAQQDATAPRVVARVDPRVELLSLVFRFAGNPEYRQGKVDAYIAAIEAHCHEHRDHAVVQMAAALRRARGVSYDAVMGLAVHLDDELQPVMPLAKSERLDRRWSAEDATKFIAALRDFAKDVRFADFVRAQRGLHELTAQRMQAVIDEHVRMPWFDQFFGARPTASFELALGLLNGGACYGPSVRLPNGKEQLHCILGVWQTDAQGKPTFDHSVVGTVVHEFCHSYCNALMEGQRQELQEAGEQLFAVVADDMRRQAYGNAQTMLNESLVRAAVVRYQLAARGEAAAAREIAEQHALGFHWTGGLAALLGEYEAAREQYATLEQFMPRIVAFFQQQPQTLAAEMAARPRVVAIVPANGAKDVDPATKAIVVTFDRPMRDGCWAVVGGGEHFPKTGKPSYDAARKVLTIPVELKPNWRYELWLNRGKYDSFQSEDGHKLRSVHVTFHTRAK